VALVIRPSAVTGLVTNVSLRASSGIRSRPAWRRRRSILGDRHAVERSGRSEGDPRRAVTYDDRFTQISTNLFGLLAACTDLVPCTFDFNETTLSAHSYDFVVTGLSSGNYGIVVSWGADHELHGAQQGDGLCGPSWSPPSR